MLGLEPDARIRVTNVGRNPLRCGDFFLVPEMPLDVPFSFLAEYGGNPNIVADFSAFADHLRSHTDDSRPYFDLYAPLSAVDGYGRHAIDLWRGLSSVGASVPFRSVSPRAEDHSYMDMSFIRSVHDNRTLPPAKVALSFSMPYDAHHHSTGSVTNVALTQFETDHIPFRHIENVGKANHLIVTSKFQVAVWKRSGMKLPISVMTPGIDTDLFSRVDRPRGQKFRVLILGALSGRKNTAGAVRIFQRASNGDPGWQLTIKHRGPITLDAETLKQIRHDGRIKLLTGDMPPAQIVGLYHNHDCLIWPSKGEGVGLPPLEAMSTGMDVVLSDSSGMSDYMDRKHCWPIRIDRMEPAHLDGTFSKEYIEDFGGVGNWWLPDETHGVQQLQKAMTAWYEGKGKGRAAADYVRSHHTLQHQAESVLRVVQEYL